MGWTNLVLGTLLVISTSAFGAGEQCRGEFKTPLRSQNAYEQSVGLSALNEPLRYPLGARGDQNRTLQFGFESEYTLDNYASKLMDFYMPEGMTEAQWLAMKPEAGAQDQRVQWIRDHLNEIFRTTRQPGRMKKITNDPELSFLPEFLILDTTGNLEYILDPRTNYEAWVRQLQIIENKIGPGSMQGTVSMTFRDLFGRNSAESIYGYLVLTSEIDLMQKLKKGYEKYVEKGSGQVARPLVHPFVGPMTRMRSTLLLRDLRAHATGQGLTRRQLEYVSGEDSSYKYMGATVYRPDILPGRRAIFEIRDAHSDTAVIRERMGRMIHYAESGFAPFLAASNIQTFDQVEAFARFPQATQQTLAQLFPSTAKPNTDYTPNEIIVNEVFRAISYPLRNWDSVLAVTGAPAAAARVVGRAQLEFQNRVHDTVTKLGAGQIDQNKAKELIQFAVTQFVVESEILNHLERFESEIFNQTRRANRAS